MTAKILTVAPEAYPGTTAVLKHYNVTGFVEHTDEISQETVKGKEWVIVGGWHPIYYEALHRLKINNISRGLFWTSSVGQMDFSNDGMETYFARIIADLVKSEMIDKVFLATPFNLNLFQQFIPPEKTVLLPYAFDWDEVQKFKADDPYVGEDWVDLYCPGDTRKNMLVQMHGAKIANAHIHFSGMQKRYKYFADLIGVKYTDMGWMPKDRYYTSVQTMKLGLQVTFAETFDYVVAEHFALKRPCLFSTVMSKWIPNKFNKELRVLNPDDPMEVGKKIKKILKLNDDKWEDLNTRCYNFMKEESERRNEIGKQVLATLLSG